MQSKSTWSIIRTTWQLWHNSLLQKLPPLMLVKLTCSFCCNCLLQVPKCKCSYRLVCRPLVDLWMIRLDLRRQCVSITCYLLDLLEWSFSAIWVIYYIGHNLMLALLDSKACLLKRFLLMRKPTSSYEQKKIRSKNQRLSFWTENKYVEIKKLKMWKSILDLWKHV